VGITYLLLILPGEVSEERGEFAHRERPGVYHLHIVAHSPGRDYHRPGVFHLYEPHRKAVNYRPGE